MQRANGSDADGSAIMGFVTVALVAIFVGFVIGMLAGYRHGVDSVFEVLDGVSGLIRVVEPGTS